MLSLYCNDTYRLQLYVRIPSCPGCPGPASRDGGRTFRPRYSTCSTWTLAPCSLCARLFGIMTGTSARVYAYACVHACRVTGRVCGVPCSVVDPNGVGDAWRRTRAVHLLRPRRSPATSCNLARSAFPLSVPRARTPPDCTLLRAPNCALVQHKRPRHVLDPYIRRLRLHAPRMQAPCWSTPSICRAGRTVQQDAGEYTPRGARAQRHQRGDAGPMRISNVSMHALRFMRVFPPAWLPTDDVAHASAMYEWQACIKHAERMPIADVLAIPHASVASTSNSTHATHNIAPAANPSPAGCASK